MSRFDRYMLGELLKHFGFFALILVSVYWVNRAVVLFDALIADGQSARVFLEFTTLALPNIIRITLPFAAFAASIYVTNRLSSDSELLVMQATGFSPFRMARPVLTFGIVAAIPMLALTMALVPVSQGRLLLREAEVADNLIARLLTPDRFIDAGPGVTVYLRNISPAGELEDLLLSDRRSPTSVVTYTARKAYLVRTETGPRLVMIDGQAQSLRHADNRLSLTAFTDFAYDISDLIKAHEAGPVPMRARGTLALMRADTALQTETGESAARLRQEGHGRINQALLTIVAALLGFAPLMTGGFSRFGRRPQMAVAAGMVILVMGIDNVATTAALAGPEAWPLTYGGSVMGLALAVLTLGVAARGPRPRRTAPARGGAA